MRATACPAISGDASNGTVPRAGDAVVSMNRAIRDILTESGWLAVAVDELSDDDDLYAAGLTSHGSVNLMLALEERFDIEFPEQLLRRRTFESIAAIRTAIAGLRDERSGP